MWQSRFSFVICCDVFSRTLQLRYYCSCHNKKKFYDVRTTLVYGTFESRTKVRLNYVFLPMWDTLYYAKICYYNAF